MLEAVRRARAGGIRTGLVSNSWGTRRYPGSFGRVVRRRGDLRGGRDPQAGAGDLRARGRSASASPPRRACSSTTWPFNLEPAAELGMATVHHRTAPADARRARAAAGRRASMIRARSWRASRCSPWPAVERRRRRMVRLRAQATRVCARALEQDARIAPPPVPARTARRSCAAGSRCCGTSSQACAHLRVPSKQAGAYSAAARLGRQRTRRFSLGRLDDLDRGADPLTTVKTLQHRLAPVEADDDAAWRTLGVPACVTR